MKKLGQTALLHLMRLIAMLHGGEWALLMLVFCLGVSAAPSVATNGDWVFFGTYTGPNSQGIYAARFDEVSGELGTPLLAAETKNPSFLALHPNGRFLYAVGELSNFEGRRTGAVSAFAIDRETGKLKLLNQQSSGGAGPCHLAVDTAGQCVLAANYGGGSIAVLPIGADGSLGPATTTIQHAGSSINPQRQAGPHAHYITPDPVNRFALVCDLGLDQVLVYRLAAGQGKLLPHEPPACRLKPGLGPRHLAFHPNGRLVFVINEMGSSLTVLRYDLRGGQLAEVQTISTLPEDFKGQNSCAEVQVHPSGKFVAASNRGHDSIALFTVDPATGKLTLIDHQPTQGKTPRHFAYAPSGRWLLAENQDSGTVKVFRVDTDTGKLKPTGQGAEIGSPVCAVFLGGNRGKN